MTAARRVPRPPRHTLQPPVMGLKCPLYIKMHVINSPGTFSHHREPYKSWRGDEDALGICHPAAPGLVVPTATWAP